MTNQLAKILGIYAKFADLTQTTIFYIQDLFQSINLTIIPPQITQECIKTQQKVDCLIFLSF